MSRFNKKTIEATTDFEGKGLSGSGMFENVTIVASFQNKSSFNKGEVLGFVLEKDGKQFIEYNAIKLFNGDGKGNDIGQDVLHQLCMVAGIEDGLNGLEEEPDDTMELPTGKGKVLEEQAIWSQLSDMAITYVRIANYYEYEDAIKNGVNYRNFYRDEDKATAGELAKQLQGKDVTIGTKFAKDLEYYSEDGKDYTDYGVFTADGIKKWKNSGYSSSFSAKSAMANGGTTTAVKTAGRAKFGSR